MTRRLAIFVCAACFGLSTAAAQTIFIVRHAERTGDPDPPLNADGVRRAQNLARLLADAKVRYFYTSDTIRAQQTAEPTAKAAGRRVEVILQADFDGLVRAIRATASPANPTLVVGHRESLPRIVEALGGGKISSLRSDEHDRLIVLTFLPGGGASVLTLRY